MPITALFVLLIGGPQADNYSVNYLVHMLFGVLVGAVVNVLILPPLYLRRASARLDALRDHVAGHLNEIARWLREDAGSDRDWSSAVDRRRNHRPRLPASARSRAGVVLRARPERGACGDASATRRDPGGGGPVPQPATRELPPALDSVAALVSSPVQGDESPDRLAEAEEALADLQRALDRRTNSPSDVAESMAITVALTHIVDASRPFVAG